MPSERQTDRETSFDEQEYMKLMKGYQGPASPDFSNVTPEQERQYCKELMEKVFQLSALKRADHEDCFNACVDKCVKTGVLRAHVWEEWGGYPELRQKMTRLAELTNQRAEVHILDAETMMAAIAVKMLRTLKMNGTDDVTPLLLKYKMFGFSYASVKVWHIAGTKIIRTGMPYGKSTSPPVEDTKVSGIRQSDPNNEADDMAQTTPERRSPSPRIEVGNIPAPLLWSSKGAAETILGDLEHVENVGNMDDAARQKLRVIAQQMRFLYGKMEFKQVQ